MTTQLAFDPILKEVEEQMHAALDQHRSHVQSWFDQLSDSDKQQLAALMTAFEYDTCVALSAAAGDYAHSH
jgi:hypothetical protein